MLLGKGHKLLKNGRYQEALEKAACLGITGTLLGSTQLSLTSMPDRYDFNRSLVFHNFGMMLAWHYRLLGVGTLSY